MGPTNPNLLHRPPCNDDQVRQLDIAKMGRFLDEIDIAIWVFKDQESDGRIELHLTKSTYMCITMYSKRWELAPEAADL